MITQTGLLRKFRARIRTKSNDPDERRRRGHELVDALEEAVMTHHHRKIPRHLVQFPGTTQGENRYAVLRYLGQVSDREYFLGVAETSVERHHSWNGLLYVGRASHRRPTKVTRVPVEDVNEHLITLVMGSVARMLKRKLPFFRIPRGYYPYGYFYNWVTTRWGRRKHNTIHRDGILVTPTMRQACRKLIKQFDSYGNEAHIDSLNILTRNGYVHLDTVLNNEHAWVLTPEFFKHGRLKIDYRNRRFRRRRRAA